MFGAILAIASVAEGAAQTGADQGSVTIPVPAWVTLGTMGGPMPFKGRSQPANALIWPGEAWLIDCGDGAVGQLAKTGLPPRAASVVFLSHLHFDHTAGLAGLIGLRFQTSAPGKLAVYGPPGTHALVEGIMASMKPAAEAGYGVPGERSIDPVDTVVVHELADGESVTIKGVTVRAVQNSHYSFEPGSPKDRAYKSFSYRFDLPGRAIVYTGDTGPSAAVDRLGKGADLLVSEMIDVGSTIALVRKVTPDLSDNDMRVMEKHLAAHHLTPEQVGDMAARMGVKHVVVTHLAGATGLSGKTASYAATIAAHAHVGVDIASDLDRF